VATVFSLKSWFSATASRRRWEILQLHHFACAILDKDGEHAIIIDMPIVTFTEAADRQIKALPLVIQDRIENDIVSRLEKWPATSGAKPLRGNLKGHYRIRTGDYRVLFYLDDNEVVIHQVGHRRDVYDE